MATEDKLASEKASLEADSPTSLYSPELERRVKRKVDLHLLPLLSILYLCSFLDRGNIGNARVAGMATDLNLTGIKYQLCAAVFFIPYCLMEVPCNVLMKLFRPSRWIPSIMLAWGLVMLLMAFVKSYQGLLVARVFLGLAEAGLPPGVAFLVTIWYRRHEQARPISLYFSSATVAGAFGGLLAFAIEKMEGLGNLHGWAWIFLLEGLVTMLFAIAAYFLLPDYPETATFLNQDEKTYLVESLKKDRSDLPTHFDTRFIWQAMKDYKTYVQVVIYTGMVIPLYAFSLFLPTIIKGLGFSANNAQLLTIPPYVAGCASTIIQGILSDRARLRGPFVSFSALLGIIGYAILYGTTAPHAAYAGTVIAACGVFPTVPLLLTWSAGNAGGEMKKGVVIAMLSGFGNLGGIVSSFVYRTQDTPKFHLGHGIVLGCLCIAFVTSIFAIALYRFLNKKKEERCAAEGIDESRNAEFTDLGCDSPLFRYSL